ncbi:MAG: helix-turn-helix transcriptional regulator [Bacteroidetes bacterium]|nr:helix-turn-helix transcriptional regulator [Bacteroidota bacterium]
MRKNLKTPRILKIKKIDGYKIICMFNNGESRMIDFELLFNEWNISENDVEFLLLEKKEFKKVQLRNYTLSWNNVHVKLLSEDRIEQIHPYEIDPYVLFKHSKAVDSETPKYGSIIRLARRKAGLTQEQLAERSGTSRFYISRLENNKTDIELSTFRKIVEAGLGKHLRLVIE